MSFLSRPLFLLLLSLTLSVDVFSAQAPIVSYPLDKNLKSYPEDCLFSGAATCVIKTNFHRKYHYRKDAYKVSVGSSSGLLLQKGKSPSLLEGELWLSGTVDLNTEYGIISCRDCEAYIIRTKSDVKVRALSGIVSFKRISQNANLKDLVIPVYTENWMGRVAAKTGISQTGIPQPIEIKIHIRKWAQFYSGTKYEFEKDVERFRRSWAYVVHDISSEYAKLSGRRIATVSSEKKRKKEQKKRAREADKVFRDMLRQRALYE